MEQALSPSGERESRDSGEGEGQSVRELRLQLFARSMRREPTPAEQRLWLELRAERLSGIKFRRQKVIGPYIADFAANEPKLVVEVDGHTHGERERHDAERTRYLQEQGYLVVRFTNDDVLKNLEGVLRQLTTVIDRSPLPTLSPEGERALNATLPSPLQGRGRAATAARERGK